jgi:hypothetical protein
VRPARIVGGLALLLLVSGCDAETPAPLRIVGGDPQRGRAVIAEAGCGACHVIPGVLGATSWVGPPLTEWSRRGYVGGPLPNTPANLVAWLRDPASISPGSAMPDVPAGMPLAPDEAGPREAPRLRPR